MTTPRDLTIVAMDLGPERPVEPGDLSLALAGAEVIDLLGAGAVTLDGDRVVPGGQGTAPDDRLLAEAAAALVRQPPHESVEDWLWRRGRDLSSAYRDVLTAEGHLARQRRRWLSARGGPPAPAETPDRRHAADRWAAGEPVLAALAAAAGVHDKPSGDSPDVADEAVVTVLAAVNEAVLELEAVRQRRTIEKAAFDNIWRGQ